MGDAAEWRRRVEAREAEERERRRAKYAERQRVRRAERLESGDFTHGTTAGYTVGCRCEACTAAATTANRRRQMMRIILDRINHGSAGYRDGCRCDVCRASRRDKARKARAKVVRGEGVAALTPNQRETLALIAQGLTNEAIAEDLGRSVNAVGTQIVEIYRVLGLGDDPRLSKRVAATLLYQATL